MRNAECSGVSAAPLLGPLPNGAVNEEEVGVNNARDDSLVMPPQVFKRNVSKTGSPRRIADNRIKAAFKFRHRQRGRWSGFVFLGFFVTEAAMQRHTGHGVIGLQGRVTQFAAGSFAAEDLWETIFKIHRVQFPLLDRLEKFPAQNVRADE